MRGKASPYSQLWTSSTRITTDWSFISHLNGRAPKSLPPPSQSTRWTPPISIRAQTLGPRRALLASFAVSFHAEPTTGDASLSVHSGWRKTLSPWAGTTSKWSRASKTRAKPSFTGARPVNEGERWYWEEEAKIEEFGAVAQGRDSAA